MSFVPETIRCDGCLKKRDNDTNHWFLTRIISFGDGLSFQCLPLSNSSERLQGDHHYCGQACALKGFSRYLDSGKLYDIESEPKAAKQDGGTY